MLVTFSVYVSETAQKPVQGGFGYMADARLWAGHNLTKYVIRRSTANGPRGMIVHTQR